MRKLILTLSVLAALSVASTANAIAIRTPQKDVIYCHKIGDNSYKGVPKKALPLLREVTQGVKKGQRPKAHTIPVELDGVTGLYLPPYTAFRIRHISEPKWECFMMINDDY